MSRLLPIAAWAGVVALACPAGATAEPRAADPVVSADVRLHAGAVGSRLLAGVGPTRSGADPLELELAVWVDRRLTPVEIDAIAELGLRISPWAWVPPVPGHHPHGFHLARARPDVLERAATHPRIVRIASAEWRYDPLSDIAREIVGADALPAREPGRSLTGAGVRIAIADSGLDPDHPDLPLPIESFDVTTGDDPSTWSADVVDPLLGHGTWVAGAALGRGTASDGRYRGLAPDADLIVYRITRPTGSAAAADIVRATLRAVEARADILSLSYGGYGLFLDGSDLVSQAFDAASRGGVTCFAAAGNDAATGNHAVVVVPPGGTSAEFVLRYELPPDALAIDAIELLLANWRGGTPSVDLEWIDPESGEPRRATSPAPAERSPRGTAAQTLVWPVLVPPGERVDYRLRLVASPSCEATSVHLYRLQREAPGRFTTPTAAGTVNSPASADLVIGVGATTSRLEWTDAGGTRHDASRLYADAEDAILGDRAAFSSFGPRIDGVAKPELLAPGFMIVSCRDGAASGLEAAFERDVGIRGGAVVDDDGLRLDGSGPSHYLAQRGTSAAAPIAAGVAALLLEAHPDLGPAEIRRALTGTDAPTGPSVRLDARAALARVEKASAPCAEEIVDAADCDGNGVADVCEEAEDCDEDGVPDVCQIAADPAMDADGDGTLDACIEVVIVDDCDGDGIDDDLAIARGIVRDCNADGRPDACEVAPRIEVATRRRITLPAVGALAVIDRTGEGQPELAVGEGAAIALWTTELDARTAHAALPGPPIEIVTADLDGDGRPDIAARWAASDEGSSSGISSYLSLADGSLVAGPSAPLDAAQGRLLAADLDVDGRDELAIVGDGGWRLLRFANGESFAVESIALDGPAAGGAIGDVDGDGDLDLVAWLPERAEISILRREGDGWSLGPALDRSRDLTASVLADLDGDGRAELVALSAACGALDVEAIDESGLRRLASYAAPASASTLAVGDIDGDGRLDAAVTGAHHMAILLDLRSGRPEERSLADLGGARWVEITASPEGPFLAAVEPIASTVSLARSYVTPGESEDCDENGVPDECEPLDALAACRTWFHRGDTTGDGRVDISDGIAVFAWLFAGGDEPGCAETADANDDGTIELTDGIIILSHLFLGAPEPAPPGPPSRRCGPDPADSPRDLGCREYGACP